MINFNHPFQISNTSISSREENSVAHVPPAARTGRRTRRSHAFTAFRLSLLMGVTLPSVRTVPILSDLLPIRGQDVENPPPHIILCRVPEDFGGSARGMIPQSCTHPRRRPLAFLLLPRSVIKYLIEDAESFGHVMHEFLTYTLNHPSLLIRTHANCRRVLVIMEVPVLSKADSADGSVNSIHRFRPNV